MKHRQTNTEETSRMTNPDNHHKSNDHDKTEIIHGMETTET